MKTKSVWMMASVALFCAASHADEKGKEAAAKPDVLIPAAASDYIPFVVPLPKDESGFATKPPEGGALKVLPGPKREIPLPLVAPHLIPGWRRAMELQAMEALRVSRKWKLTNAPLSVVLSTIEKAYKVNIIVCFSPEKLVEDVKITMSLSGETVEQKLDGLKPLGLVWRGSGNTYYIAWSENDLPPAQNAITPAPQ